MEKVSIIIVTWNSEKYIKSCLSAINPACPTDGSRMYEIILVDNNSEDRTVEIVKKQFPKVHIIKNSSNVGLSKAINQGTKLAKGKYIFLLNPDVIMMEDTIENLYRFIKEKKEIGACGPRFLWANGKTQFSCREFPSFGNLFLEFIGIGRIKKFSKWKMGYFNHNTIREVDQPMGSCLMVRKETFSQIGGMNESYPIFMNDVDLCYKIKKLGYKIYFLPEANVIHYLGSSTRLVRRKMILEEHWSIYRYLRDHFKNRFLTSLFAIFLLTSAFYRILFTFLHCGKKM
ncbi:glycosyltransferase family 2 protein [candidate division WOR-3 bacterium]|nr:glycosyltransferase family 2 protein [candidate division WOR-3 bacterium]